MIRPRALLLPALLAGAVGGIAWTRYASDLQRARRAVSSGSSIAATACGPIEYSVTGEGSPLLLVHGAGGGFDQGRDIVEEIVRRGHRVITVSRFGYLRTPLPVDASAEAQADAHAALLEALGIERVAIAGVSAGAPSAMQFALRHPYRTTALALLVPLAFVPGRSAEVPSAIARFMYERVLASDFLYWSAMRLFPRLVLNTILGTPTAVLRHASAEERRRVERLMEGIRPVSARQAGMRNDSAIAQSLRRYDLERIAVPTLVMSVQDDLYGTYESARYTAAHIPGARFVGFPGGGHVWVGHHEEVISELTGFLAGATLLQ